MGGKVVRTPSRARAGRRRRRGAEAAARGVGSARVFVKGVEKRSYQFGAVRRGSGDAGDSLAGCVRAPEMGGAVSQAPDKHNEKQDEEKQSGQEDAEVVEQKGRGGFWEPCGQKCALQIFMQER